MRKWSSARAGVRVFLTDPSLCFCVNNRRMCFVFQRINLLCTVHAGARTNICAVHTGVSLLDLDGQVNWDAAASRQRQHTAC